MVGHYALRKHYLGIRNHLGVCLRGAKKCPQNVHQYPFRRKTLIPFYSLIVYLQKSSAGNHFRRVRISFMFLSEDSPQAETGISLNVARVGSHGCRLQSCYQLLQAETYLSLKWLLR